MATLMFLPLLAQETPKATRKEQRRQRINAIVKQEEEGVIKYKKHTAFGAKPTVTWRLFQEIGRAQDSKKSHVVPVGDNRTQTCKR